jgi:simple sugar transport system ATP-binding protein
MRDLAIMMVGREVHFRFNKEKPKNQKVVLKVENVEALDDRGLPALKSIGFDVRSNEILGIAGVEGNGQTELVEALAGLRKISTGRILLNDIDVTKVSPGKRIELGTSVVPEDRQKRGLILDFSVMENLMLGSHDKPPFASNFVRINIEEACSYAERLIEEFSIKTPDKDTLAQHLSGGTQQRVVLAREFSRHPKLIVASQPTRGLDIGATEYVHGKLVEIRNHGCAVLLISADLDEIWALSDRIAVIYEGRIVAVKDPEKTNESELGLLMAGGKSD